MRKKIVLLLSVLVFIAIGSCQKESHQPLCSISGFTPALGMAGTTVIITGQNFSSTAADNVVKFNGVVATITNATSTSITTTVPVGATTGAISVAKNEHVATSTSNFTVVPADGISNFSPSSGSVGTTVTITGINFDPTPTNNVVKFNGVVATVTGSTATTITTTVPSGATKGPITVTVEGIAIAASTSSFVVIPTITSFTPSGGYGGATSVTITGTGYDPQLANNTVKFNGLTATVTAATATSITSTVPVGTTTGPITVTVAEQTATSISDFIILVPTLTGISPTSGKKNSTLTITGTNFDLTPSNNHVTINGNLATVVSATATQLTVTVPQGAGSGIVAVTVDGTPADTGGLTFQFNYELTYTASTFAGNSTSGINYQEGTGTGASFYSLAGIAVDTQGNIYVADGGNNRIRKITPQAVTSLLAGSGLQFYQEGTGAGADFNVPGDVAVDADGNVFVADTFNGRIRKITPDGVTSFIAMSSIPVCIGVDAQNNIYVGEEDPTNQIQLITPLGASSTFAGSTRGFAEGTGTAAQFYAPNGMAIDSQGNIYVADTDNSRIRKITPLGVTSTVAGNGTHGYVDGTGSEVEFFWPTGVAVDGSGTLYVADRSNNVVRMITTDGVTSTIATIKNCYDLAVDGQGNVYVTGGDNNNIIYKIVAD